MFKAVGEKKNSVTLTRTNSLTAFLLKLTNCTPHRKL